MITDKIIQIDEQTEIDSPVIEIENFTVWPKLKQITVNVTLTSGRTVLIREIGPMKYSSKYTIADIETFIQNFISEREKP